MIALLLAMVHRPTDAELVQRFKEGDRNAYSELVRRYQNRVFTLCLRYLRGDREVAEEVAQDVFMALFKALGEFRGDAKLSTWIYRVTINHCKNRSLYRKRRAHGRHESIDGIPEDDDKPQRQLADESSPGSDASVHQREAKAFLQEALDAMDEEQRQIIVLRDIEDLSYEEISELLDLPKGTVKSRLHRARAELAKKLNRRLSLADVV
ncbi:MAG: sigma-70 family RNA polymerase sigma factor [Myxococcota bacterium]|nr:sigma-70 family RNA polymerase sigma factor [Myxococcota bacterium]